MDRTIEWLVERLSDTGDLGPNPLERNIFEAGWIDSFETILLVEAIEVEFDLRFTQEAFQDRRFTTIRGIAEIVAEVSSA